MFEMIFKTAAKVTLHEAAPYARERARYLQFYAEQGYNPHTVHIRANELLRIASRLKQAYANLHLTKSQIKLALQEGSARTAVRKCASDRLRSPRLGVRLACTWLQFLGCLQRPRIPFSKRLDAYCRWAREERGLSEETIAVTYGYVKGFLCWYGSHRRSIAAVRISDIDDYLAYGGRARGWSRHFVCDVAKGLKAFFRYGGEQGWASVRLAACIRGPRLYAFERLPQCPSWPDVQRLLRRLDPKQPNDARDRAILMLLAFYFQLPTSF